MKILGIVGKIASGKGEIAKVLVEKGFHYLKLSDLLRDELKRRDIPVTRENLTELGNNLRQEWGPSLLAKLAIKKILTLPDTQILIDGIRNPAEISELKRFAHTTIIAVDANTELRKYRYMHRAIHERPEDKALEEEFFRIEEVESSTDEHGQNIPACIEHADFIIFNESSLDEFHRNLDEVLASIDRRTVEGQARRGKER